MATPQFNVIVSIRRLAAPVCQLLASSSLLAAPPGL
jgi:hypothetical protein